VKIENFEKKKKMNGRIKILGRYEKQHGIFLVENCLLIPKMCMFCGHFEILDII
jgi:hypothetical protein